ncbi:alpha/beta fold hydrolase, partial [Streptomyces sp. RPT161]|uniref:alpha/beta fold hydrolase n=1 Tax=Streptomyces sp. RPT161 TaxID=3015993 RepID=UPI0022B91D32
RQQLAELPPTEREQVLLALVRESATTVLGHAPSTQIDSDQPFKELGFDSLTGIELRNLLQAKTGASLPASVVFDYPDPETLANGLGAILFPPTEPSNRSAGLISTSHHDLFGELYLRAMENGQLAHAQELMLSGAQLRAKFHDPAELDAAPSVVRIGSAQQGPHMICVCPTVMTTGPQVYTRFAEQFTDGWTVSALVPPGFDGGEALPATREALVRSLADSVEDYVGDSELSLVGHSSGGVVAYELAKELQGRGLDPTAVVLIDSYSFDGDGGRPEEMFRNALNARMIEYLRWASGDKLSERITAQVWSLELLRGWRPEGLSAPTLYVRPIQPLVEEEKPEWRGDVISMMTSVADVPGDHFTILEGEHVGSTARVVDHWLRNLR